MLGCPRRSRAIFLASGHSYLVKNAKLTSVHSLALVFPKADVRVQQPFVSLVRTVDFKL